MRGVAYTLESCILVGLYFKTVVGQSRTFLTQFINSVRFKGIERLFIVYRRIIDSLSIGIIQRKLHQGKTRYS